jgi:hypothetical protein
MPHYHYSTGLQGQLFKCFQRGCRTKFFAHLEVNPGGASACEPVTRPHKIRDSQALAPPENLDSQFSAIRCLDPIFFRFFDRSFSRRGQGAKWLVASGQWRVVGEHQSRRSPGHSPLTTGHSRNSAPSAPLRERVFPFFGPEDKERIAWQPPTVQTPLAHHFLDNMII